MGLARELAAEAEEDAEGAEDEPAEDKPDEDAADEELIDVKIIDELSSLQGSSLLLLAYEELAE